jgi:hypothetical protein
MRSAATKSSRTALRLPQWRALTWVLLFAFAFQSYVTQTHFHGAGPETGHFAAAKLLVKLPGQEKLPPGNDSSDCPFCQAIAHSGAFFSPTTPLFVLPVWAGYSSPFFMVRTANDMTARHGWQSRAPPLL